MIDPALLDLVLKGGAIAVLLIVGALILRGDLQTKSAVKATLDATILMVTEIKAAHTRELAAIVHDRDEWKTVAKDAVADVRELTEALTVRNRIDEELRRSGVLGKAAMT
jgi:hypothetical protein